MNMKEMIDFTKNDGASMADERLWESARRIRAGGDTTSTHPNLRGTLIFRIFAYFCMGAIFLLIFILLNLFNPTVRDPYEYTGGNFALGSYYRYGGKYYKTEVPPIKSSTDPVSQVFVYIQTRIVKRLSGNLYEIAGVDPSKSIAFFDGRFYYKLNYAFEDSITLNGRPYLIRAPNSITYLMNHKTGITEHIINRAAKGHNFSPGEYLGKAGDFYAYAYPGADPSEVIAIKLNCNDDIYNIAYQLPSSVTLNGAAYEVQPGIFNYSGGNEARYLGKAGPYDAYPASNFPQSIILHIDGNKAAIANIISEPSYSDIPQSIYDSRFQTMDPISEFMQFDHKIYSVSSTFDYVIGQRQLRKLIGDRIGSYSFDETFSVYEIYTIEGMNSSKSIALKNNEIYVRYDYFLDTIVKFNGKEYEISLTGDLGEERGWWLGMIGSDEVYAVKGVDPSKGIIVLTHGSSWTAYSVD